MAKLTGFVASYLKKILGKSYNIPEYTGQGAEILVDTLIFKVYPNDNLSYLYNEKMFCVQMF